MAPGNITVGLYVANVPEGLKFSINEIKPIKPKPEAKWYTYTTVSSLPLSVNPTYRDGYVGEFRMQTEGLFSTGHGPYFEIHFTVSGTLNGKESSRTGYFTVATSDWGYVQRPDFVYATYVLDGSPAHTLATPVPSLQTPDPVHIMFDFDKKKSTLAMLCTSDRAFLNQVIDIMLTGIFAGHKKAADWAVGKVW